MTRRFKAAKLLFQQPCFAGARTMREEIALSGKTFTSYYDVKISSLNASLRGILAKVPMVNNRFVFSDKYKKGVLAAGHALQTFRDNSAIAYFVNCYSNTLGYDYIITEQLAPKLLLAQGKPLPYEHFSLPSRCFFINLESLSLTAKFDGSRARTEFMDSFEKKLGLPAEYAAISGEIFNWQKKTTSDTFISFEPQSDAVYDLIGFSCILVDELKEEFLNLLVDYPTKNCLVLNAIYLKRGESRFEVYPFFFTLEWIRRQSVFIDENNSIYSMARERAKKFFYTDENAANFWTGLNAAINSILYLNTTSAHFKSETVTEGISRSKIKVPKKGTRYLDKQEYQVAIVGNEGFPDSWGLTTEPAVDESDWVVSDEELDEMMDADGGEEIEVPRRERTSEYVEPHTRRAHVQTFWVTESHPRYGEAKIYEMKSRGSVMKKRGLIEVMIDDIHVNVDKPSKYTAKITKMK